MPPYRTAREELAAEHALELDEEDLRKRWPAAVPTRGEMAQILSAAKSDPRLYLMVRMLYASGLRRTELAELGYSQVDWPRAELFVNAGKCEKDRTVMLDAETLCLLSEWRNTHPPRESVFALSSGMFQEHITELLRDTGLYAKYAAQNLTLSTHSLRHAFATHSFENGMDAYVLKALLGHQVFETTLIYIATARIDLQAAYQNPGGKFAHP